MTLTPHALSALVQIDNGARLNVLSVVSRELIEAGMAFDDFGRLEITEAGRHQLRRDRFRMFDAVGDHVANMGDMNQPMWHTPVNSHPLRTRDQDPPGDDHLDASILPDLENLRRDLSWDRSRVRAAAGAANGACGIWVEPAWVEAFIKAFENEP